MCCALHLVGYVLENPLHWFAYALVDCKHFLA